MKTLITIILLLSGVAVQSQSWNYEWALHLKGADGVRCQVETIDDLNQCYLVVTYADTITIGDTVFSHPYLSSSMQCAIGVFDQFGTFKRALDFHSPGPFQPALSSVKAEKSHSLLIGGECSNQYHASDTVIFAGSGGDVFIGKYNEHGKHKWIKTISGPFQDRLINFIPAEGGTAYVIGSHAAYLTPVWINFFGADSVEHTETLTYVLKLDSLGNIIWQKHCTSLQAGFYARNATLGNDGNLYVQGETHSSLVFGADTLWGPGGNTQVNFIYAYDGQGNLIYKHIRDWPLSIGNIFIDTESFIYFGAHIFKTTNFANDTVLIPPNHFPSILGKMDRENNLLWYHLFEPTDYQRYHWLAFSMVSDTIFANLTYEGQMVINGIPYGAFGRRTLIMQYSTSGTMHSINTLQGSSFIYSSKVLADHCSDIIIGGMFIGMGYFGQDTLKTTGTLDGFITRVNRWEHSIDLGPDTLINMNDSIRLSAGNGYDTYLWSTGGTDPEILVTGAELGAGVNEIWVLVTNNGCRSADTVYVMVKSNIGMADLNCKTSLVHIYPNPITDFAVIDYELPGNSFVQIKIFNFTGTEVGHLANHQQQKGKHKLLYDARYQAPGIYYCQIRIDDKVETQKMIIMHK
ncbi:MAG: T9SS type A sorting domain-containing protein [Bacteroidales bacterium]|nr:T9SS type A sorting domain-containing protein [Bacteroidales bacterium]